MVTLRGFVFDYLSNRWAHRFLPKSRWLEAHASWCWPPCDESWAQLEKILAEVDGDNV